MISKHENIRNIAAGQRDDYTTGCLLDYHYFKKYHEMITIDLSRQQALDADPRAIQQINFTANLDMTGSTTILFRYQRSKKNCLRLFTRNCKSFVNVL